MSETKMTVDAGACRFITDITASTEDGMTIDLVMKSNCPAVKKLAAAMPNVQLFDSIATPINENAMFIECGKYLVHAACPIPFALVKACEVVGELCLRKDVSMKYV